jgi:hypothetical protein
MRKQFRVPDLRLGTRIREGDDTFLGGYGGELTDIHRNKIDHVTIPSKDGKFVLLALISSTSVCETTTAMESLRHVHRQLA